jgi:ABC-type multidrug transport system ATPase subunit
MMNTNGSVPAVLVARDIHKRFQPPRQPAVQALQGVSFEAPRGMLTALVGPDGAGKTTLIRLAAGLLRADSGELTVLGVDAATDPQQIQDRISYMPQRFGLYEDLTVAENIDLYADLHGVSPEARAERYPRLMEMTALGPFKGRLAGKLSGGMKQKLGLACTLVRSPELLLLDEPTVGVDPLSRRELWEIVRQLVDTQGLTVLLSTAYLDEAERCSHVIVLHQGKVLAQGQPGDITDIARNRVFVAELPAGQSPRVVQSRLLDEPGVIDAVPDGECGSCGRKAPRPPGPRGPQSLGRLARPQGQPVPPGLPAPPPPVPPGLLPPPPPGPPTFSTAPRFPRQHPGSRMASWRCSAAWPTRSMPRPFRSIAPWPPRATKSPSTFTTWSGSLVPSRRSTTSVLMSAAERSSVCSDPTELERPPRSECFAACCLQLTASCAWPARMYVTRAPRRGRTWAMLRRSSLCMAR